MLKMIVVLVILVVALGGIMFLKSSTTNHEREQDVPKAIAPQTEQSSADGMLTFKDRTGRYQIRYPSSWKLADNSRQNKLIRADLNKDSQTGIQIRLVTNTLDSFEEFVDWYVEQFLKEMGGHWQGTIEELDRDYCPIGIHRGCQVTIAMERGDGKQWLLKEYLWPHKNKVVVFQCGTTMDSRFENEPILDSIAETLDFF